MALTLRTHDFKKDPNTGRAILRGMNPYIRISREGVSVFVQGGKVYSEGGGEFSPLPGWFGEEAAKVDKAQARLVGLDKIIAPKAQEAEPDESRFKDWTCPVCHEEMKTNTKGLHIARHKRKDEWVSG